MVEQRSVTVAVVGEFKRGKSTLVNALLQTAACPVDADIVTGVPTWSVRRPLRVIVHRAAAGRARGDPAGGPLDDLAARCPSAPTTGPGTCARSRYGCPTGCCGRGSACSTPPGRRPRVGPRSAEPGQPEPCRRVLFVTDASQELTAPELEFLETAVERCPRAALVVTKTDLHQHWRGSSRRPGHLVDAGLEIPVLPLSSFLRLRAAGSRS